ncbi:MAG TPA: DUF2804 domain-containing protein [Rectinemataceae bacterium]|nr:DUF2804 domain-containing protein [Rectinemataceae bacterium]
MQHEITEAGDLLDTEGRLVEPGWCRSPLQRYRRGDIRAPGFRVKEWDYYLVTSQDFGLALTIADNSYMGLISVTFFDFKVARQTTESLIVPLTFGKIGLPSDSRKGDVAFRNDRVAIAFANDGTGRKLSVGMRRFKDLGPLDAEIELIDEPPESMVVATPFADLPRHFYFNRKIVGMRARGMVGVGGRHVAFEPNSAFGLLDWGRGVWPYSGTWYWGAGMGLVEGKSFGWNVGYGFGDTKAATENMLFYEGRAHKLEGVVFNIPKDEEGGDDFMSPWTFASSDGRFEMDFAPRLDRAALTSVGPLMSDQHQVFGLFSGRARLDGGRVVEIRNFPGFAEKVRNRW